MNELPLLPIQFLKFAFVGCSGLTIDFAVTYSLKEKFRVNKYGANSAGFFLAASSNYLLNRFWTFGNSNPDIAAQYLKFFVVSLVGLLLNNILLHIFHKRAKLNFYAGKLFAIGLVLLWNFTANYFFTFIE